MNSKVQIKLKATLDSIYTYIHDTIDAHIDAAIEVGDTNKADDLRDTYGDISDDITLASIFFDEFSHELGDDTADFDFNERLYYLIYNEYIVSDENENVSFDFRTEKQKNTERFLKYKELCREEMIEIHDIPAEYQ